MIDVSVIVIARNVRDEVRACLRSVAEHAGPLAVEAIVVDNGSTDGTPAIVAEEFPDVRVVALANNEGGSARNHGMRIARGRYRMFLDSDALLTPGALEDLVAYMDAHPEVGLVGPRLVYPSGELQPSARRLPALWLPLLRRPPLSRWLDEGAAVRRHLMLDVPADRTREAEYVIGACQLFSAAAQEAAGELDPRIPFAPEDIDWCLQIRAAGLRVAYRPEATVVHVYRRTTARHPVSRAALDHLRGFLYFRWKWRRSWRALVEEGRAMERRGWALDPTDPLPDATDHQEDPVPRLEGALATARPYAKFWARRAALGVAAPLLSGDGGHECPCCGRRFRRYLPYRGESLRLPDAWCPGCGSLQRHRVMWLYLRDEAGILRGPGKVLHFAPEWAIYRNLHRAGGLEYHTADLQRAPLVREQIDITAIPYPDETFDWLMVSHVLEHVPDDRAAMAELRRVLKPTGTLLMQHPIDFSAATTIEDASVEDAAERLRRFGQSDHVRVYGRDHLDRLREAGLSVERVPYADELPADVVRLHGLHDPGAMRSQDVYVCRRA